MNVWTFIRLLNVYVRISLDLRLSRLYENYDVILPDLFKIDDWLQDRDGSKFGRIKKGIWTTNCWSNSLRA